VGWSLAYLGLGRLLQLVALLCRSERSKELEILLLRRNSDANDRFSGISENGLDKRSSENKSLLIGRFRRFRG
jgi:hypothetical protein